MCRHCGHRVSFSDECYCGSIARDQRFLFRRRYVSRAERIARLEEYLEELQAEVKAVQEQIAEMKLTHP
jgi:hypothetical protein